MDVATLILGAGAAGLFCAGRAGPGTLVVDHAAAPGEKIRISGGGRCNFTNLGTAPGRFLSQNPHFAKAALAAFRPEDFLALLAAHRIPWHEKGKGELFCDRSAKDIVAMLMAEAAKAGAEVRLRTEVAEIGHDGTRFRARLVTGGQEQTVTARHLVVATGGKSIPKMGATGLAYRLAAQFGLRVTETRPALVPFVFDGQPFAGLAGLSLPVVAAAGRGRFEDALLFTHRGLSGPAILQVSSYWREGEALRLSLLPPGTAEAHLRAARAGAPRRTLSAALADLLPARLAAHLCPDPAPLGATGNAALAALDARLSAWELRPTGTEGYRTAEVTLGGVATEGLSARTMEAKSVPGLFFVGEGVDVTGWLGGYNFQWAWASADAAARAIRARGGAF